MKSAQKPTISSTLTPGPGIARGIASNTPNTMITLPKFTLSATSTGQLQNRAQKQKDIQGKLVVRRRKGRAKYGADDGIEPSGSDEEGEGDSVHIRGGMTIDSAE
jgi:hypothetical protein